MKAYVQFLVVNTAGKIDTALGSDGVFILDGRNCLAVQKTDAMERMHKLRHVHDYVGYRIMRGNLRDSHMVYEWIRSGVNHHAPQQKDRSLNGMNKIIATRPDGYNGTRVTVTLSLQGTRIIETHAHGIIHTCPAVSCAVDMDELNWLFDHHPNFKKYRRVI